MLVFYFLAHLRGVVATFHTEGTQGSNYGYGMATIDETNRSITQLYNLARGYAVSQGRHSKNKRYQYIILDICTNFLVSGIIHEKINYCNRSF
jgi:hypothetical protein